MAEAQEQTQNMGTQHRIKVDVPDRVLYTVGSCVLVIGSIGITGNLLVLYAFYSNKRLRTPANYFIMNLAASDFLMSATQAPICFLNSMHTEWVLGDIGSYIPEGLMISCTWDYVSYSPANRSYTMMLCCFVFFIPLIIIFHCYLFMFLAIRSTGRNVQKLGSTYNRKSNVSQSVKSEWKLAKIAFVAIVVFVLSWSPYACVTLIAWAGYAKTLNPYSKSVPAVIAKASAIYNPIIYAIIHPRYRRTIRSAVPCLRFLIRISPSDLTTSSVNESSFRASMSNRHSFAARNKSSCVSSISAAETTWSDMELEPVEAAHKKRQPQRSSSFSEQAGKESGLLLKTQSCNVLTGEKIAVSSISLHDPFERSFGENAPELLLKPSCLRTSSLPFGLNSSSTEENADTSHMEVQEQQTDGSLNSLMSATIPQIVIVSTSETTLSEEQYEPENGRAENSSVLFSPEKNHLLDIGRLSSSTNLIEAIEKLLS
ncbi:melanopsin isoform X2 [Lacerta agilis]|uniref:melanopsin isoform X2 n=1 Tax=Lacerta agilis TaxID=80427 RepID=UPI001419D504|nr:melanopsin isoform X2 [Lacerta agilis]